MSVEAVQLAYQQLWCPLACAVRARLAHHQAKHAAAFRGAGSHDVAAGGSADGPVVPGSAAPAAERVAATDAVSCPSVPPFVQGVFGIQGSGKTTTCLALRTILSLSGYKVAILSLDDLYLPHKALRALHDRDPRFARRGPPGTHDLDLARTLFDGLASAGTSTISLPRFDKSLHHGEGDRVAPEQIGHVDVLLFEGWFVGCAPLQDIDWRTAPPPIDTDAARGFAQTCNEMLADYAFLWAYLDDLIALVPTNYHSGRTWRHAAEDSRRNAGQGSLSKQAIDAFMNDCWTAVHPALFVPALLQRGVPSLAVPIQENHLPPCVGE